MALFASLIPASAQIWDPTGNTLLNGNYFFRQVAYGVDVNGNTSVGVTVYGGITFDGHGNYQLAATLFDSRQGFRVPYSFNGTYSISASGFGFINQQFGKVSGLVSNGVFVGSSVDGPFQDLIVAVAAGSATSASFNGSYSIAYMNIQGGFTTTYDTLGELNANGISGIGTFSLTTHFGLDSTDVSSGSLVYGFNAGAGSIAFPQSGPMPISGTQQLLLSPDGNFIFGGSPVGFDFYVGVRKAPADNPPTFGGLYYQAGINQNNANITFGVVDTFYGSFKAVNGTTLGHQRHLSSFTGLPQNFGYQDTFPTDPTTQFQNSAGNRDFVVSADGTVRIGLGHAPFLGIEVALRAPEFSGPGIYLNPTGIVNGASYSSFTSGVARGELVILYGTNLADGLSVSTTPFPLMLGGVQVLMNNRPCALYYVSPGAIAAIVPYGTIEPIVQIQIVKNGQTSNAITTFRYESAPGVFSLTANGVGLGAVLHPDFSIVTEDHPAHPGEFVQIFLTGLGDVFPTIADGAPGGSTTLNTTLGRTYATVNRETAEVSYSGLAPTLSGLYQMNIKIPDTAVTGNLLLGIGGPDAFSAQVSIPVAVP